MSLSPEDLELLAKFAEKIHASSLSEALRMAIALAEVKLREIGEDLRAAKELLRKLKVLGGS